MTIASPTDQTSALNLYTAEQVREMDRQIMAEGVPGILLMKRAGRAAFHWLLGAFSDISQLTVYVGAGNNAGDGYIVAALAAARNIPVVIIQVGNESALSGDAKKAWLLAREEGVEMQAFDAAPTEGVIVDALLGIGVKGDVRGVCLRAIEQINNTNLQVLALDLPSGLCANTGAELGLCVQATMTMTFIAYKRGLFTGRGPTCAGELRCDDLKVAKAIIEKTSEVEALPLSEMLAWLPMRQKDAHKGDFGHVMIIGGDTGCGGAALMAAEAAARSGAGLVSLATRPEHVGASLTRCPEIMVCGVATGQELEPWLVRPTVLVVGPGLGQSAWGEQMLQLALKTGLPLILDADALNLMAKGKLLPRNNHRPNWLLTPHPGEAARLVKTSVVDIQRDRFAAVKQLQANFGGAVILKGVGSLVAGSQGAPINLIQAGNPGMASGGMGDVLSGLLGALVAQGLTVTQAANLGASLHATAADMAVEEMGQQSLLATDLLPFIGELLRG